MTYILSAGALIMLALGALQAADKPTGKAKIVSGSEGYQQIERKRNLEAYRALQRYHQAFVWTVDFPISYKRYIGDMVCVHIDDMAGAVRETLHPTMTTCEGRGGREA